jgi:glycine/D-amino acid oxidase-like deaminating enzyme
MAYRVNRDVIIVGAGIVGCATAYFLAREGLSVTVLDPNGIAAAASGRNNGLIEHPYDAATVGLFDETVGLLAQVLGDGFPREPVGALLLTPDEAGARELVAQYSEFPSLAGRALDPDQLREAEPLIAAGLWACLLDTGHPIMPVEATTAFADLARGAGAEFVLGEPLSLISDGTQVQGATSGGGGVPPGGGGGLGAGGPAGGAVRRPPRGRHTSRPQRARETGHRQAALGGDRLRGAAGASPPPAD